MPWSCWRREPDRSELRLSVTTDAGQVLAALLRNSGGSSGPLIRDGRGVTQAEARLCYIRFHAAMAARATGTLRNI
ncbi:hypothetical protein SKAU_G00128570 [Synaphobranchus kaupii]|uniref:Uncharacterized protein n=1 Tax=Synaphobranchus kaupii TaxID=118154 RepID=A0A9Q1J2S2_SYNKA|nr:hypothetical protein SKAU_G00128570 [Synaphobranchus kaupii]